MGPQYRSIILYHSPDQERMAREAIADFDARAIWNAPIVTEVKPLREFYPAERYHQDYFSNNARQPYCQIVIEPKVAKFRKRFVEQLRA